MAKYDWPKLKTEYITGEFESLKDFAEAKGLPYKTLRNNATGWIDKKRAKAGQKQDKVIERTIAKQVETEAEINTKHYELWKAFVDKAQALMVTAETPGQIKTLAEVIEKAQKGQRLARGMDIDKPPTGDEQKAINIIFRDTGRKDESC